MYGIDVCAYCEVVPIAVLEKNFKQLWLILANLSAIWKTNGYLIRIKSVLSYCVCLPRKKLTNNLRAYMD